MLKPKVYVTREIPERGLKTIKERFDAEVWPEYGPPPKEVIVEKVGNVDAIVSLLSDEIDAEVFGAARKLKVVAQMAVGFDNIDVKLATKRGIYVTNTPEVLTETTADFAWALLMAVARRVVEADRYVRTGKWKVSWHPSMLLGRDVHGATMGIVGAGRIGSSVAKRAKGFNMKILYYDVVSRPELEKELGAKNVDLDTLFKESDFISVHVPLTKQTYHMINEEKLRLMKKTAYLINNSRGSVIDEKALYRALKEEWIAGAGLDVFEREPTQLNNPLLMLDNVVVAPHISSSSHETRSRMAEMVAENLMAFFEGTIPPNLVNPEVLKIRKPS
ncbi:D-glycerate dehydrogenase [Candidatus Bathyarchaeota archaeon]|nr:D-glycerate dehydrogenase [Candidatus Bathyarchaeota archaeon]